MMFGKNEGLPVDVICVEHTYLEGELLERGQVVKQMPHEMALELAAAGKVRKFTPELQKDLQKAITAAERQADARDIAAKERQVADQTAMAGMVAAAVASALQAAGLAPAAKPAGA